MSRYVLFAKKDVCSTRLPKLLHLSLEVIYASAVSLIESAESLQNDARRVEMLIHGRIIEHIHHH